MLSTSIVFASNPALAFKVGDSYGAGVTRGQDLTGKDIIGKDLIKQGFKTSPRQRYVLDHPYGRTTPDLTGADLSNSDLRDADFSLASVTKANLSIANLEGALATGNTSFKGSTITGADFTDVPLRDDQQEYICKDANRVNPGTGNETRETLLCR